LQSRSDFFGRDVEGGKVGRGEPLLIGVSRRGRDVLEGGRNGGRSRDAEEEVDGDLLLLVCKRERISGEERGEGTGKDAPSKRLA
jgi:hypothetical protein